MAFAGNVLHHRLKKIRKDGKRFDTLSARERHKLRIKIKKLRYSLEFFESLYAARRERRRLAGLFERLKGLQDGLGSLNDFAVHRKITAEAALQAPRAHRRARAFMAGVILGKEEEATKPLLKTAIKAIKRLGSAPST